MTPEEYRADLLERIRSDFGIVGRGMLARAAVGQVLERFERAIQEALALSSLGQTRNALVDAIRAAYVGLTAAIYGEEVEAGTLALVNVRMREMQQDARRYTPQEAPGRLIPLAIAAGMVLLLTRSTAQGIRTGLEGSQMRLEDAQALFRDNCAAHIDALLSGAILLSDWGDRMRAAIRQLHTRACVIATNGNPDNAALQILQAQINVQLAYFNNWLSQLGTQPIEQMSAAQMKARANLYAGAANETFSRCITTLLALPELPFYPTESTLCRTNCHCGWRVVERGPSDWDCYWTLGEAEHCPTCLARAQMARPLRVRNGRIQDALRFTAPELFA